MAKPVAYVIARQQVSNLPGSATADLGVTWETDEGIIWRSSIFHRENGGGWLEDVMHPGAAVYTHQCRVNLNPGDVVEWYSSVLVSYSGYHYFDVPLWTLYGATYNSNPFAIPVSPSGEVSGNQTCMMAKVGGAAGGLHVQFQLALNPYPYLRVEHDVKSLLDQTGWERAASPYTDWTPLGPEGADDGDWVCWYAPVLRYDTYYYRSRVWTGQEYGPWSSEVSFRTVPAADPPLTCTIGDESYLIEGLRATERTGGEASELEFRIPLKEFRARPFECGAPVAVSLAVEGRSRSWNGTVESTPDQHGTVTVHCTQDDAALARLLVQEDTDLGDVGANLAAAVDKYGDRLSSAGIETELGVNAPIIGADKSLREHLKEWADTLKLLLYVDGQRVVHLVDAAQLPEPELILHEGYE